MTNSSLTKLETEFDDLFTRFSTIDTESIPERLEQEHANLFEAFNYLEDTWDSLTSYETSSQDEVLAIVAFISGKQAELNQTLTLFEQQVGDKRVQLQ